jgi:hypothetical protein
VRANLGKAYSMEVKAGMHVGHWSLKKKKKWFFRIRTAWW